MSEKTSEDDKVERVELNLRAPKLNIAEARRRASAIGISLNAWICGAIADKLEDQGKVIPFRK